MPVVNIGFKINEGKWSMNSCVTAKCYVCVLVKRFSELCNSGTDVITGVLFRSCVWESSVSVTDREPNEDGGAI